MIYLASASPRRKELLQQIGVPFRQISVSVDESPLADEEPLAYVRRLAQSKANAGMVLLQQQALAAAPVLGSDTTVVLENRILGKPNSQKHAAEMLLSLSGKTHQVITALAVATADDCLLTHAITDVTFRKISAEQARVYWDTGEPQDKAGAYGIQGLGAVFVERIAGSYSAVVGLPLFETAQLLQQAGIAIWNRELDV